VVCGQPVYAQAVYAQPVYTQPVHAQSPEQLYAQGVLAFFNGDYHQAESYLSQALAYQPRDPRAYYFLGLAQMRTGRSYEGEQALQIGAAIEAGWSGRPMDIGRTLERVQGSDRMLLERIRREARQGHDSRRHANLQQRYQQVTDRQDQVAGAPFHLPLDALAGAATPDDLARMVAAQAAAPGDPFVDDPADRGSAPAGPPATEDMAADNPPATAQGDQQGAADNPKTPVDIPAAARGSVSAKELGGIFGRMVGGLLPKVPAGNGPPGFGGASGGFEPSEGDPLGDDPFGGMGETLPQEGSDGGDPFGESPDAPEEPTESTAPADPFSDGAGEDDPFGDDPFGDDPF
jgi:hypothetical protein